MKNENPVPRYVAKIVFIIAVVEAFFNRDEQAETAEDLLAISGSITQIGIGLVFVISVLIHKAFNIPMIVTVPLCCLVLPLFYHLGRVIHVQKKSLL